MNEVEVKAQILSYGIKYTPVALQQFNSNPSFLSKRRVYGNPDDVDFFSCDVPQEIVLQPMGLVVNAVIRDTSPWTVDYTDGRFVLRNDEYEWVDVTFTPKPKFYGLKLSNGNNVESILTYLFGHTIGIFKNTSCLFAFQKMACKFCSIGCNGGRPKDVVAALDNDLVLEALNTAFDNCDVDIDSIFISGGNHNQDFDTNFLNYLRLATSIEQLVHSKGLNVKITLNVYPPQDIKLIEQLRNHDLNVMVSTEVYDGERFRLICPGKSKLLSQSYLDAVLKKYVEVLGQNHVFNFLIQGLESTSSLQKGLDYYSSIGVCSIVHVLRIEPGTEIESCDVYVPTPEQIVDMARYMQNICKAKGFDSSKAYGGRSSLDKEYSLLLI